MFQHGNSFMLYKIAKNIFIFCKSLLWGFKCLLSFLHKNVINFFMLLPVQYMVWLYHYFKEWRKNPQWSFSCCLALLLPLNDLQGEIRGMAGTNVLQTQLQTGFIEESSVAAVAKDSRAMSVILRRGEDNISDHNVNELQGRVTKYSKTKCNKGTQTERCFGPPVYAIVIRESMDDTQQDFQWVHRALPQF